MDLERALRAVDDDVARGLGDKSADRALQLAQELESLERVQPRVDSWLRVAVGAVADARPRTLRRRPGLGWDVMKLPTNQSAAS